MTNERLTSNQPTTNPWDGDNVIAVSFEDDHEAYHALSLLKELDSQQRMASRRPSSSAAKTGS